MAWDLSEDYVCPRTPAATTLRNVRFSKGSGPSRTNQLGKQGSDVPGPGHYKLPERRVAGVMKMSPPPKPPKATEKSGPITKIDVAAAYNATHRRVYGGVVAKKKRRMFGETSKHQAAGTPMKDVSVAWNNTQPKVQSGAKWQTPPKTSDKIVKHGPAKAPTINWKQVDDTSCAFSISKANRFKQAKAKEVPGPGHYPIDSDKEKKLTFAGKWYSKSGFGPTRSSAIGFS
eukprot:gene165-978_t